jgi:ABC-2 type transport system permease protein
MGYNIMFVMFSIIFTIGSILEDKKLNTWNRIRIAPISGASVLAGNFIPTFLVGAIQMAIVFFAGQMLFGINLGASIGPIIIVFAMFTLAVTCLGLLLATALRTYEQLNAAAPVIIVATSMLGGCMWPLSIVSEGLRRVADFTPQRWALGAAEHLAVYGGGLSSVMTNILVLGAMALVFFAVSVVLYNKKQKG